MKTINLFIVGAFCALFTITGCASFDSLYSKQASITPAATNAVPVVTPAATNAVTGEFMPAETNAVLVVTPARTNTVLVPNPTVQAGIQAAGALPFPFAGAGAIALGWLYTAYAAFRNKKVSTALVTGIEAGRQILQTTPEGQKLDAKFKDALIAHQDVAGVLNDVSKLVNSLTADTVKPSP